jgi:streptomycin 6-kinase
VVGAWVDSHGRKSVDAWVADAHARAAWCSEAWGLTVDGFLPGGSLSCVLACRRWDGSDGVLKLLPPWAEAAIATEALALTAWAGHGVVPLLDATPDGQALLLARASPGHSFSPSGDDAEDCARAARMLGALASAPVVAGLPALTDALHVRFERARVAARHRGSSWVSADGLLHAERRAGELAQTASRLTAVHGDAQNKNLLLDGGDGALVAIDPEPSVGDPHFDAALWALTHRPGVGVRERCKVLAGLLDLDQGRLWSWCEALVPAEVALDVRERARAHRELLMCSGAQPGEG